MRASARPALEAALGIAFSLVVLAACGADSAAPPAATSGGGSTSSAAPAAAPALSGAPAVSPGTGSGGGAKPSDACSVVTPADVQAAFGGSASAGTVDEHGACVFDVSGDIHAGPNKGASGTVQVSFGDEYTTYDDAKVVFGDAVSKVDGLGTEAFYALTAVHAKIASGELVVGGLFVGNFDRDVLRNDTVTLTKTILPRL